MKVGDLIKVKLDFHLALGCSHHLEVVEDFGETIRARCLIADVKHTAGKECFVIVKTLEQRLEDNDMNPVMGTNR